MNYLGVREGGPPPRDQEMITLAAWEGIVGLIQSSLRTGLFAEHFPDRSCIDNGFREAITGCNERQFYLRLAGDHPRVTVPLDSNDVPETIHALEVIEFCYQHVSMPVNSEAHGYFAHRHYLYFRPDLGRDHFVTEVNSILARNHLAYELQGNGEVRRLLPPRAARSVGVVRVH